jgi:hypothetical protein
MRKRRPKIQRRPERFDNVPPLVFLFQSALRACAGGMMWLYRRLTGTSLKANHAPLIPRSEAFIVGATPDRSIVTPGSRKRGSRPPLPPMRSAPVVLLSPPSPEAMPYTRAKRLLTKGERAFWYPLFKACEGKYRIFCKVRLADVIVTPAGSGRHWFRAIRGYHVDFVLCNPQTTAPLLVVELDDRSHASTRARERDVFKESVLAAAKLPLYRVACQQAYDPIELARAIDMRVDKSRR